MKLKHVILLIGLVLLSPLAQALTLEQAKKQGRVGETLQGYLMAITQDQETLTLVAQINSSRNDKYTEIANKNQVSTNEVAKIAGEKLVARAEQGEFVRGINGMWIKK